MTTTTGSIATKVCRAIPDMPDAISGAVSDFVEDARLATEDYTGASISASSVGDRYTMVITDLTKSYAYAATAGKGTGFDFNITEFKVDKSGSVHESLAKFHFERARDGLKRLGFGSVGFVKVNG